jgi:hypothetical protein
MRSVNAQGLGMVLSQSILYDLHESLLVRWDWTGFQFDVMILSAKNIALNHGVNVIFCDDLGLDVWKEVSIADSGLVELALGRDLACDILH